ncbi:MAG: signal peptidase I [Flavobacteriales bacterium]
MRLPRFIIGFSILVGIPFIFLLYARLTGGLQFYTIASISGEPNLKKGEYMFATDWIEPEPLDLLVHISRAPTGAGEAWIQRLCGLPGDTVEIRDGRLMVNGRDVDGKLRLGLQWIAPASVARDFEQQGKADGLMPLPNGDSVLFWCDEFEASDVKGVLRYAMPDSFPDDRLWVRADDDWDLDHFGPLVVPTDSVFVLGDNRYQSLDSRFFGFVAQADIIGVAFDPRLRGSER